MGTPAKHVILNVNDDAFVRRAIADILRCAGFDVLEAAASAEALQLARRRPALILLDVRLPGIDGFEVCRRLKADPATASIPVVHLSAARRDSDSVVAGLEGGADGYLTWPVDPPVLVSTLKAHLRAHRAEEQVRYQASLLANVADAVISTDMQFNVVSWNPAAEALYGWQAEEVIGRPLRDFVQTEYSQSGATDESAAQELMQHEYWTSEVTQLRRDGSRVPILASISLIRDVAGQPLGAVGVNRNISESKRAEEALRSERDFAESLIETAQAIVLVLDTQGRIVRFNRYMEEISGYTLAEVQGKDWFSTFLPERDCERIRALFLRAAGRNQTRGNLNPVVTKDGREREIEWYDKTLEDKDGNIVGLLCIGQDITERKRAVEALAISEIRYHQLFETMLDGFALHEIICDAAGVPCDYRFLEVNPAFERMTGLKAHDIIGKTVLEVLPGAESFWIESYGQVALTGAPTLFANYARMLDRYYEVLAFSPRQGQFATIFADITERKRIEAEREALLQLLQQQAEDLRRQTVAAEESERRLRLALQNAPVTLWEQDADLRYLWMVNAREGYSDAGIVGASDYDVADPAGLAEVIRAKRQVLETGAPFRGELPWRDALGVRYFDMIYEPRRDAAGHVVGILGASLDITERKRLEAQYLQAQKMEAVGRLAGGVAHDFNNILTAIIGSATFAKLALDQTAQAAGDIDHVLQNAQRAADLTRQLLAFSRRQVLEPTILNLNDVILDINKMLRRLLGEDIELVVIAGRDLGLVKADRMQMQQVIMNLAVNARDAMPSGGRLLIETANVILDPTDAGPRVDVCPGDYVRLRVTDTGFGMSQEIQSHLFEPFFTTKEVGKGTGLGLAMVYGIVKQHAGDIVCTSAPDQGATFDIYLPRVVAPAPSVAEHEPAEAPHGCETILVVEDDASVREIVVQGLRSQGYTVLHAEHGEEALKVAGEYAGPIHLLLTDIVMPRMGGQRLAELLRQARPDLIVLFVSGYPSYQPTADGAGAQRTFFLPKPFTTADILRLVRRACDAHLQPR